MVQSSVLFIKHICFTVSGCVQSSFISVLEDLNSRLNHELTRATSHVENSRCSFYPKIESQRKKLCLNRGSKCGGAGWCILYFHCISLFRASTIIGVWIPKSQKLELGTIHHCDLPGCTSVTSDPMLAKEAGFESPVLIESEIQFVNSWLLTQFHHRWRVELFMLSCKGPLASHSAARSDREW